LQRNYKKSRGVFVPRSHSLLCSRFLHGLGIGATEKATGQQPHQFP
jgi:hypothetical protein